jgi:cathepsin D
MTAPSDDLGKLLRTLDVRDHCHDFKKLPVITYLIDNVEYTLEPEDYVKPMMLDPSFME